MYTAKELIELALEKEGGNQAAVARTLDLPRARINEMLNDKRKLTYAEGYKLVRHYQLDKANSLTVINEQTLAKILQAIVPLAPAGDLDDAAALSLAQAALYALELLQSVGSGQSDDTAQALAAQAAIREFRRASKQ